MSPGAADGSRGLPEGIPAGPLGLRAGAGRADRSAESADAAAVHGAAGGAGGDPHLSGVGPAGDLSARAPLLGRVPAAARGAGGAAGHRVREGRGGPGSPLGAGQHPGPAGAPGATGRATRTESALHSS